MTKKPKGNHRWHIIANLLTLNKYSSMVEVGGGKGQNAVNILRNWPMRVLYTIEINKDYIDHIKDEMRDPKMYALKLCQEPSLESSKRIPNNIDLVYIDADHSYESVKADISTWLPKVRKGGIICGHDYTRQWPGVIQAVDETFDKKDLHFELDICKAHITIDNKHKKVDNFIWWRKIDGN